MKPRPYKRIPVVIAAGVIAVIVGLRIAEPDVIEQLECKTFDWRGALRDALPTTRRHQPGFRLH